ncbi:hypothetical protein AJ80_03349 [Polytolypa hystricis UAMH7299]|uniref:protein-ribulosamine 3-kinase n=1 Tax=Polytolypa hystricis (strain UAMH7299) TaxID=1447883 RepID=A0A2B7YJR6_POLH7|nr:hypothetical protein AJ80_03349 [Polytolypa hystricis UAMH7299]
MSTLPSSLDPSSGGLQSHDKISTDDAFLGHFPAGSHIVSITQFGPVAWKITAKLTVGLPDGTRKQYFLKTSTGPRGKLMVEGEFHAMSEIYRTMPNFAPKPYAWGKYSLAKEPETYFFLSDFISMDENLPEPTQLCSKLVQLHLNSVSPTGKFGFSVTTCQGSTPQAAGWDSSWTGFFSKLLRHVLELDTQTNGRWVQLDVLSHRILFEVVPRLIGALETKGRRVKPSLIHGDLWEGNIGTLAETGDINIFDAAAFYAHNEMEIGGWRCNYNKIHDKVYTDAYLQLCPPSEPQEEWEDRNRMYSIYYNVIFSVNHKDQGTAVRQMAYDDMYFLLDKYTPFAPGEGPPKLTESERVSLSDERDHTRN